jgi:anaerobic C4-dicarboxylate transporter DcuA
MAWLGVTFINGNLATITAFAGKILPGREYLLWVILLVASAFLYSQAVTAKTLMPIAIAISSISPVFLIASFVACSGLFLLPTYPTALAAFEFDDTGSTRTGKYVFNHSFFIPSIFTIAVSVVIGVLIGSVVL